MPFLNPPLPTNTQTLGKAWKLTPSSGSLCNSKASFLLCFLASLFSLIRYDNDQRVKGFQIFEINVVYKVNLHCTVLCKSELVAGHCSEAGGNVDWQGEASSSPGMPFLMTLSAHTLLVAMSPSSSLPTFCKTCQSVVHLEGLMAYPLSYEVGDVIHRSHC